MLCEKCGKKKADTHVRTVVNGVVNEQNLCRECAAREGYTGSVQNSLAGMLASMFGEVMDLTPADSRSCPVCGASFADIAETGKVGCSKCYTTFRSELMPYLKRIHGSVKHVGHIPNSAPLMNIPQKDTVESLRMELNRLVAEENFEEAAVVRDKIKKLEGEKHE